MVLSKKTCPRIQFESLWALTNIASGKNTYVQALIDKGAIQMFLDVIKDETNEPQVKD